MVSIINDKFIQIEHTEYVELWGPCCWKLLHSIAWSFPEHPTDDDKTHVISFIDNLSKVLPCFHCRQHFQDYIKNNTVRCTTQKDIATWVWEFHNVVNKRTNKPIISFENAYIK